MGQQHTGCFEKITAEHCVTTLRDASRPVDLAGSMASGRQSDISADTSRSLEAGRIVDRRLEAERGDRTDTRHGHEPSDLRIITCQLQNLAIEIVGLLLDGLTCLEQRPDHSDQLGTVLDQFLGPHGKDIELGTADHETDVLEQAADLVLEIALDLDQQRPARQQRPNRVAIEVLDAHLLKPAGLHDAGDAGRIVAVTLIDLHLEYRLGVARVDADHRHAKLLELGPQAMWLSVLSQGRSVPLPVLSISRT